MMKIELEWRKRRRRGGERNRRGKKEERITRKIKEKEVG